MATLNSERPSSAYQRALDALLSGETAAQTDASALTAEEQTELIGLARTARLTHLTLQHPEPAHTLEAEALARAQEKLAQVGSRPLPPEAPTSESLAEKLRRWFKG
jgi:hypothetical protein